MKTSIHTTVFRNCEIIDVRSNEIVAGDIEIRDGVIRRVTGPGLGIGDVIIDCSGLIAAPGFIDAHFHTESTLLSLAEIAKLVVPHGTTTLIINPHEIANVLGLDGIRALLDDAESLPIRLYLVAPCKVPTAPGLETSGASFGAPELMEMLTWPQTVGAGEFIASDLIAGDRLQLQLLAETLRAGKTACGHAPGLTGNLLEQAVSLGLSDDHESHSFDEVVQKLRNSMTVLLREGTTEKNVSNISKGLAKSRLPLHNIAFCTDDKHPDDISRNGHINLNIRLAVEAGIDPVEAVKMATINCADHYALNHFGAIVPGRAADLVFLPNLSEFKPEMVVSKGEIVVEKRTLSVDIPSSPHSAALSRPSINAGSLEDLENRLKIEYKGSDASCIANSISISPSQILTRLIKEAMAVGDDGTVPSAPDRGINKVCVLDRYTASGRIGTAFIRGFNIKNGAIASSVAHDHHNIIAVGDDDKDIALAIRHIADIGGGLAVVSNGAVTASLPLPIAGLISTSSAAEVIDSLKSLNRAAAELGCTLPAPFMTLSFVSLPVVPELGITDMGLIDVANGMIIPPVY